MFVAENMDNIAEAANVVKDSVVSPENEILNAVDGGPTESDAVEVPIPKAMVGYYKKWSSEGLPQDELELLLYQYDSSEALVVPQLNKEIELLLNEATKRKDEFFRQGQELIVSALVSLGGGFAILFDNELWSGDDKETKLGLTSLNSEAAKLICHLFFEQNEARKAFILATIRDEQIKALLKGQKTDAMLFGSDLPEKIAALSKVKKVSEQILGNKPTQKSAKAFLANRANHPKRQNKQWSGQGQQRGRWTYNKNQRGTGRPFLQQQRPQPSKKPTQNN